MNKIININLGGYPFVIDEDAFSYLQIYLNTLKKHFDSSEGYEEIISDIECRLAELIEERLDVSQIVSIDIIKEITEIMGAPHVLVDEEEEEVESRSKSKSESKSREKTTEDSSFKTYARTRGRRLFRDPENKIIGGVCSGVSSYLGIEDPVWVRLVFGILLFTGGISVLPYIILMIILPKAETSADRLAMQGEPINIDNIAKSVEEEFENLSGRFKEVKDDFNFGKKKRRRGRRKRRW